MARGSGEEQAATAAIGSRQLFYGRRAGAAPADPRFSELREMARELCDGEHWADLGEDYFHLRVGERGAANRDRFEISRSGDQIRVEIEQFPSGKRHGVAVGFDLARSAKLFGIWDGGGPLRLAGIGGIVSFTQEGSVYRVDGAGAQPVAWYMNGDEFELLRQWIAASASAD